MPRPSSALPSIVKAKQKPLAILEASSFGGVSDACSRVLKLDDPPVRAPGVKVGGVQALLDALAGQRIFETVGV